MLDKYLSIDLIKAAIHNEGICQSVLNGKFDIIIQNDFFLETLVEYVDYMCDRDYVSDLQRKGLLDIIFRLRELKVNINILNGLIIKLNKGKDYNIINYYIDEYKNHGLDNLYDFINRSQYIFTYDFMIIHGHIFSSEEEFLKDMDLYLGEEYMYSLNNIFFTQSDVLEDETFSERMNYIFELRKKDKQK